MSLLTIFLGIVIFLILFYVLLYLYNKLLRGAIIYDLKKNNVGIAVTKPTSSNYYFSVWIYVNSFANELVTNYSGSYNANVAEQGKPIFYYGESFDESSTYILDSTNDKSKALVYLQLGANSPKLQYYYTSDIALPYQFINISDSLPLQKWSHVIISTVGSVLEFYLDGKLIKTVAKTAPVVTALSDTVINIGKRSTNIYHDTFISRMERVPEGINAKTAYKLFKKGPGTGLNIGNIGKYDLSMKLIQNNNVIKTYTASSIGNIFK